MNGELWQEIGALTKRLFIQLQRRPATLIAGVLQPMMWLLLFGALFQYAPKGLFGEQSSYLQFLTAGIIVFTAFSGALNAGLPLMFDREFGFLNRILVAPLVSRFSIVVSAAIFISTLALVQTIAVLLTSMALGAGLPTGAGLVLVGLVVFLLVVGFTVLSLGLAFALPGHQELLAFIFLVNLPLLFSSTALSPLTFMPQWLRWIASLNPLSFAIEPIRYVYSHPDWTWHSVVMQAPWGEISILKDVILLAGLAGFMALAIAGVLRRGVA